MDLHQVAVEASQPLQTRAVQLLHAAPDHLGPSSGIHGLVFLFYFLVLIKGQQLKSEKNVKKLTG